MTSERLWILILMAVSFLAGGAGGVLYSGRLEPQRESGPHASYEALFVETFDLDPERARDLRYVLDRYHSDVEELKARSVRDLEPELVRVGRVCRDRIRKYVLPPGQVEEFDRRLAGMTIAPKGERDGSL